jgi:hypothetical protein
VETRRAMLAHLDEPDLAKPVELHSGVARSAAALGRQPRDVA